MGSHSYLQNLNTNIHVLDTRGLLNSKANRWTTTNVGQMHGGYNSEINLGLMEMPTNIGRLATSGMLNSVANRYTTTNVGQMAGDKNSVISLGLQELDFCPQGQMRLSIVDDCFTIPDHKIDVTKQLW